MTIFHVWLRPLGETCRILVDEKADCEWLLSQLNAIAGFEGCRDLICRADGKYTFCVPFGGKLTAVTLTELLRGLPQIELMSQPA